MQLIRQGIPAWEKSLKTLLRFRPGAAIFLCSGGVGSTNSWHRPGVEEVKIWVALAPLMKYHG